MAVVFGAGTHIQTSWTVLKQQSFARQAPLQFEESASLYTIFFFDGPLTYSTVIFKGTVPTVSDTDQSQNDSDKADFEGNYKTSANSPLDLHVAGYSAIVGIGSTGSPDGGLVTVQGQDGSVPVATLERAGTKKIALVALVSGPTPAVVNASSAGPFNVGGTTFTISVNGGSNQTYSFPTRAALAGVSVSSTSTATANTTHTKLKVSVDGGATKTITIASNLTSGSAIAAALQSAIRANVPNGGSVVVDYGVTNPGQYTITSGTTGASSSVVITDAGNTSTALAAVLGLGVLNGGTETLGSAANTYLAGEVVDMLGGELSGVSTSLNGSGAPSIQTVTLGTGASLHVISGGANTALGFPTTTVSGTAGSNSTNLAVNGSSAPASFKLPSLVGNLLVYRIEFLLQAGNQALKKFGAANQLANGFKLQIVQNGQLAPWQRIFKTNGEVIAQASSGQLQNTVYRNGNDLLSAAFTFKPPILIQPNGIDGIVATVQDDLSGSTTFNINVEGLLG